MISVYIMHRTSFLNAIVDRYSRNAFVSASQFVPLALSLTDLEKITWKRRGDAGVHHSKSSSLEVSRYRKSLYGYQSHSMRSMGGWHSVRVKTRQIRTYCNSWSLEVFWRMFCIWSMTHCMTVTWVKLFSSGNCSYNVSAKRMQIKVYKNTIHPAKTWKQLIPGKSWDTAMNKLFKDKKM